MICPSCNYRSVNHTAYCIRCGFSLAKKGPLFAALRGTCTWILRRSLAGFTTGLVGWCVIALASRAAGAAMSQAAHLIMSGLLGGFFLGSVEGMMEESTIKTVRGASAGAFGGILGGMVGVGLLRNAQFADPGMMAILATWGIVGGFVGMTSGLLERKPARLLAGVAAGIIGGALGGWLGYQLFGSLMDILKPEIWILKRLIEGMTGAVLGLVMWFVMAVVERFYIFKRRWLLAGEQKTCDYCHHVNTLNAWYCGKCGTVLQVAALPEELKLPKNLALARVISACQFLARLVGTTSFVLAFLATVILGSVNMVLGLVGLVGISLIGYIVFILLNSLAEALSPLLG